MLVDNHRRTRLLWVAIIFVQLIPVGAFGDFYDYSKGDRESRDADGRVLVRGAGSDFAGAIHNDAVFAYSRSHPEVDVSFTMLPYSRGAVCRQLGYLEHCDNPFSGNGVDASHPVHIDFGTVEGVPTTEERAVGDDLALFPAVIGGISPVYNLGSLRSLVLSPSILSRIFRGCDDSDPTCISDSIRFWNHTDIVALNPDAEQTLLEAGAIKLVVLGDDSDITWVFKRALSHFDSKFRNQIGTSRGPDWPATTTHQTESIAAISAFVSQRFGSIGYTSMYLAKKYDLPTVSLGSTREDAVSATTKTILNAAIEVGFSFEKEDEAASVSGVDLFTATGQKSWPLATYSYFLMRLETNRTGGTCTNREATVKYLHWFYTNPMMEKIAVADEMAPLPSDMLKSTLEHVLGEVRCSLEPAYEPPRPPKVQLYLNLEIEHEVKLILNTFSFQEFGVTFNPISASGALNVLEIVDKSFKGGVKGLPSREPGAIAFVPEDDLRENWDLISESYDEELLHIEPYLSIPMVAKVNLCGMETDCPYTSESLVLEPSVLAQILDGEITRWDDEAIVRTNANSSLPAAPITVVQLSTLEGQAWISSMERMLRPFKPNFGFRGISTMARDQVELLKVMLLTQFVITVLPVPLLFVANIQEVALQLRVGDDSNQHVVVYPSSETALQCVREQLAAQEEVGAWGSYQGAGLAPVDLESSTTVCYPFARTTFALFTTKFVGECEFEDASPAFTLAKFIEWLYDDTLAPAFKHIRTAFIPTLSSAEERGAVASKVHCNGYSLLKPLENLSLIPELVISSVELVTWLIMGMCILFSSWTMGFRSSPVIRVASPGFLLQVTFGSMLMLGANFPLVKQEPEDFLSRSVASQTEIHASLSNSCLSIPYLWSFGFGFCYTPLILKSWRVVELFRNSKLKKVHIPNKLLAKYEVTIGSVFLFINVLWSTIDPLRWHRFPVVVDENGNTITSSGTCYCTYPWLWIGLLLFVIMGYLLYGNYLARKGADVPVLFNEGKWIGFALTNMLQILIFSIPVFVVSQSDPSTLAVVRSMANVVSVVCTISFVFLPKLFSWYKNDVTVSSSKAPSNGSASGASSVASFPPSATAASQGSTIATHQLLSAAIESSRGSGKKKSLMPKATPKVAPSTPGT